MIRLLIVDDHEIVRHGLKLVLNQVDGFIVVGDAADGVTALSLIYDLVPDVVLLDWKMPQMDGLTAAQKIKKEMASVRTLLLSGAPIDAAALDSLDNGVDGFVHKDINPDNLIHAIQRVAAGERYLGAEITKALIARSQHKEIVKSVTPLSHREQEVLALMATPATYRDIASELIISEETVRTYVKRILTKLNQPNRTQAVIAALRLGLISID
jgi:DNA-binding NarL/FixJ family response regulator